MAFTGPRSRLGGNSAFSLGSSPLHSLSTGPRGPAYLSATIFGVGQMPQMAIRARKQRGRTRRPDPLNYPSFLLEPGPPAQLPVHPVNDLLKPKATNHGKPQFVPSLHESLQVLLVLERLSRFHL